MTPVAPLVSLLSPAGSACPTAACPQKGVSALPRGPPAWGISPSRGPWLESAQPRPCPFSHLHVWQLDLSIRTFFYKMNLSNANPESLKLNHLMHDHPFLFLSFLLFSLLPLKPLHHCKARPRPAKPTRLSAAGGAAALPQPLVQLKLPGALCCQGNVGALCPMVLPCPTRDPHVAPSPLGPPLAPIPGGATSWKMGLDSMPMLEPFGIPSKGQGEMPNPRSQLAFTAPLGDFMGACKHIEVMSA